MNEAVAEQQERPVLDLTEKIQVLLVDDDPGLLKVAKQCLEMEAPLNIDTCLSAEEALKKLENQKYDVIISDYKMPVKDGLEFLRELRAKDNRIPFIMFTGKGREEVAIRALNLGASQYLNKLGETETVYAELAHSVTELAKTRKAEEKQSESEQKFRNLFEKANDGLVFADTSGRIIDINQKAAEIAEKTKEEIIGKSFLDLDLVSQRNLVVLADKLKQQNTGKKTDKLEFEIQKQNGQKRLVEISSTPIQKGNTPTGHLTIVRDITERKQNEEALKESETKYRTLVDQSLQGIVIAQEPGPRISFANKTMANILGYTPEQLESLSPEQIQELVHPEDRDLLFGRLKERLEGKQPPSNYEVRGIRKDGTTVWLQLTSALLDYNGQHAVQATFTDVTERKRTEEALRKSEAELAAQFYGSPDLIMIVDRNHKFVRINRSQYLSYDVGKLLGTDAIEVLPPDQRDVARTHVELCFATGNIQEFEHTLRNGEIIHARIVPLPTGDTIDRVMIISANITERKSQQKLLEESQQKFASLFTGNPEATVYVDCEMRILDINSRFESLFGYSLEDIKGKNIDDTVVPESQFEEGKTLDEKAAMGCVYHDTVRKKKDGSLIPVSVSAAPIRVDDKLIGYVWLYKDISHQKAVEESLKESEEKFRALFAGAPEAAVCLGPDFRIQDINHRFEQVFGYSLTEIKGKLLDDVIVQEGKEEEAGMLNEKAVEGYVYHDTVRRRKDGSLVPVSISAAPIIIKGHLSGTVGTYKDISDLKSAQQKLAVTNEKLKVVGGITRHDIKNKLSILTGNTYLMKKKLKDQPQLLGNVEEIASACAAIVKILEFARDYDRLGVEELTYVDLEDSIQKAVSLFTNDDQTKVAHQCHGLTVLADSLLSKLFYNLIDNSLKHGNNVTRIGISCQESEDELMLTYEDNGVGIAQEAKPKLFSEGYTTGNGTGYGLYLIKKMMEAYGWNIQETGLPGKGARFVIVIPKLNQQGKENYRRNQPQTSTDNRP